jgi:lysophospholipase L1-like esterase
MGIATLTGSGWSVPALQGASNKQTYLGQVATGCGVPNNLHASNLFSYSRCPHWARDDIRSLQIVLPNWYVNASMVETNGGGIGTWTASIEYPAGTFTQVTFSGSASGTVAAGANLVSDAVAVTIPSGAKFWTRLWQSAPGKMLWTNQYCGDGSAQMAYSTTLGGCPDLTMGGTAATVTAAENAMMLPVAIIAQTCKPSIGIVGDSISVGKGDIGDAGGLQGYLSRAFGGRAALVNVGVSSDTLVNFIASGTKRRALVNDYCSHVIVEYGSNDVTNARTAAQILADTITVLGYFPTKRTAVCTLTPRVTSTDAFVTEVNQTVLASEAVRVVVNAQRRNGLAAATTLGVTSAIFDIERACESAYLSGKWQVIGGTISPATATYTDDGVHPNRTGYMAIAASINPATFI